MGFNFPDAPAINDTFSAGSFIYKFNGTGWTVLSTSEAYVQKTGDTMSGHLALPAGPAAANAVRKDYVDAADALKADITYVDSQNTTQNTTINGKVSKLGDTMAGHLTISENEPALALNKTSTTPNTYNYILCQKGGVIRWAVIPGDNAAETGSNTGSDFQIQRYSDAATGLGTAFHINRANGNTSLQAGLIFSADSSTPGNMSISRNSGYLTFVAGTGGYKFKNNNNTVDVMTVNENGVCAHTSPGVAGAPVGALLQVAFLGGGTQYGISFRPGTDSTTAVYFTNAAGTGVGTIGITATNTAYNTSSDERLKEDLKSFDAGNIIDDTNVYDFAWKSTGERSYGIIAQQANQVYPNAVTYTEKEDWWGIDYSKYVPVLLQELKALRVRVAVLEGGTAPKKRKVKK